MLLGQTQLLGFRCESDLPLLHVSSIKISFTVSEMSFFITIFFCEGKFWGKIMREKIKFCRLGWIRKPRGSYLGTLFNRYFLFIYKNIILGIFFGWSPLNFFFGRGELTVVCVVCVMCIVYCVLCVVCCVLCIVCCVLCVVCCVLCVVCCVLFIVYCVLCGVWCVVCGVVYCVLVKKKEI